MINPTSHAIVEFSSGLNPGSAAVPQRVRLRRLHVVARRQPDRRCDRVVLHADCDLAAAVAAVGPGSSLAAKVAVIESSVAADDTADACAELVAFGHEVNAQAGKKLATMEASALVARGQGIEAALGC
jgi:hypothetical protein